MSKSRRRAGSSTLTLTCLLAACGEVRAPSSPPDGAPVDTPGGGGPGALAQRAYVKASNAGHADKLGHAVALSADGSTLAVSAPEEASAATGIDGDQTSNTLEDPGAVYVFARSGTTLRQQAYVKASNTDEMDWFGASVALSADGSTLAVGAPLESSGATGIGGDQGNDLDAGLRSGAVYVFRRIGTTWSQQAYIKASDTRRNAHFGISVALSSDGATLAVGAHFAGAAYVFTRAGGTWAQQARVEASNARDFQQFGSSVALSGDGRTMAVGARCEGSAATGIDGDQADTSADCAGAVYVFARLGTTWSQQAYVKASNTNAGDQFGHRVALSGDGSTLAVSAHEEDGGAPGVGGDQTDNSAPKAGAAYVFTRSGTTWAQQAYVKASNTGANDGFGEDLALSGDGSTLAVGAPGERSAVFGIDGIQTDDSAPNAGAAYLLTRAGAAWSQQAYVKASNTDAGDRFGFGLALSTDGSTLAVGATFEGSAARGIDGDEADNSLPASGAVYLFQRGP